MENTTEKVLVPGLLEFFGVVPGLKKLEDPFSTALPLASLQTQIICYNQHSAYA